MLASKEAAYQGVVSASVPMRKCSVLGLVSMFFLMSGLL